MVTITTRLTRPSLDVEFYQPSEEYKKYFQEKYIVTNKILNVRKLDDTDLIVTTEVTWDNEQSIKEFLADEFCYVNFVLPRQQYSHQNNIKIENSYNGSDYNLSIKNWKNFNISDIYKDLVIPDDWDNLEAFVDWYIEQRMPLFVPWNAEVIKSDDACAVCIFRKGNYQVEFYLEYPKMFIRKHAHPRMEVITLTLGGGALWPSNTTGTSYNYGEASPKLHPGNIHGGDAMMSLSKGFVTLAFQRWESQEEMTSAAVQWKGELQGPIQAELIKSKKPLAQVDDNFADTTNDTGVNND
jgi:hypothetical protein